MVYFSAFDFNIIFSLFTRCEVVSVDDTNVCECSFSNTYWNNNYFCPFWSEFCSYMALSWKSKSLVFNDIFLSERFHETVLQVFSFISGITFLDASTGGDEETSLCCWSRSSSGECQGLPGRDIVPTCLPPKALPSQASN